MDIDRFIKQDISFFLEKEQHKDISIKNIRSDEMTLFDIDKDYVKEMEEQLKLNNVESGRELFNELRKAYNRTPEASPLRRKIFSILKEMHDSLKKYIKEHKVQSQITFEIQYYDQKGIFIQNTPPKKILTAEEEKDGGRQEQDESYNLLKDSMGPQGQGSRDIADMMSQEISRSIPLEESPQLRNIFVHAPVHETTQRETIIMQTPSPQAAQEASQQTQEKTAPPQMTPKTTPIQQAPPQMAPIFVQSPQTQQSSAQTYYRTEDLRNTGMSKASIKQMVEDVTRDYLDKQEPKRIAEEQRKVKEPEKIETKAIERINERPAARTAEKAETTPGQKIIERVIEKETDTRATKQAPAERQTPTQIRREIVKQEQEEKSHIDIEKESIKKRQAELEAKLEELKKFKLYKEELELLREKEKKEVLIKTIDKIIQSKRHVKDAILKRNIATAKNEYSTIKQLFQVLPPCEEKKELYKDILALYDQIRFADKEMRGAVHLPQGSKEDITTLKNTLLDVKKQITQGKFIEARTGLANARTLADSLDNQHIKEKAHDLLDYYEKHISDISTKYDTYWQMKLDQDTPAENSQTPLPLKDQANLYLKGVNLLYNNQKKEASSIFRQIISANPNNIAARIRLTEAMV